MNRRNENAADKEFQEQVIAVDRVARVVKGGRRFRFRALVVIGDGKNKVGVGISKGADVQTAITKAVGVAKKNMATVTIEKGTIPHEVEGRSAGAHVLLKPAREGTGLIAGGTVRSVLDVTGVNNILSKSLGSSNKINVAYATVDALTQLVPRDQWITSKVKAEKSVDSKVTQKDKASSEEEKK